MITQEQLRQFVNYDPETGIFIRISSQKFVKPLHSEFYVGNRSGE